MSDEQINVQSWEVWGYEPQGSIEIAAPEALPAVVAERKRRNNRPPSFCRLRRQTAPVLYVRRGKRDGKRDYKLSTETGEVQSMKVGRMSSWSEEGRVMPAYVAGDATLGEVTPQRGKGTLGHGGRGKGVHAFRTLSRVHVLGIRAEQGDKPSQ